MSPYALLFWSCAASGILLPVPEDLPLVVAGTQVHAGELSLGMAIAVAVPGVFLRDAVFFTAGRYLGDRLFAHPLALRFVGAERLARAREVAARRGAISVLMGRLSIGVRATAFLVAGAVGVPARSFAVWDFVGLLVTVPLMVVLGVAVGGPALAAVSWLAGNGAWVVGGGVVLVGGVWALRTARRRAVTA